MYKHKPVNKQSIPYHYKKTLFVIGLLFISITSVFFLIYDQNFLVFLNTAIIRLRDQINCFSIHNIVENVSTTIAMIPKVAWFTIFFVAIASYRIRINYVLCNLPLKLKKQKTREMF